MRCPVLKKEIRQGRMKLINAGVLKQIRRVHVLSQSGRRPGWSSFDPEKVQEGERMGEELKIPCITTRQLMQEHGKPFFMKVDIEGADLQTLHPLTQATAPAYVSLELNKPDSILERLVELGYSAFKLVDGATHRSTAPIFDHQTGWRLLRKAGRILPVVKSAISRLPQRLRAKSEYDPPGIYSPDGYSFTAHSSGPFGEQADGPWLTSEAALRRLEILKHDYRRAGEVLWWDVHARHSSIKGPS